MEKCFQYFTYSIRTEVNLTWRVNAWIRAFRWIATKLTRARHHLSDKLVTFTFSFSLDPFFPRNIDSKSTILDMPLELKWSWKTVFVFNHFASKKSNGIKWWAQRENLDVPIANGDFGVYVGLRFGWRVYFLHVIISV